MKAMVIAGGRSITRAESALSMPISSMTMAIIGRPVVSGTAFAYCCQGGRTPLAGGGAIGTVTLGGEAGPGRARPAALLRLGRSLGEIVENRAVGPLVAAAAVGQVGQGAADRLQLLELAVDLAHMGQRQLADLRARPALVMPQGQQLLHIGDGEPQAPR